MVKFAPVLVIGLLLSCATSKKNIVQSRFASNPVVAHRGAFKKNGFPENSIAGLREAIQLRCTGSEFDVRMSADDSLVINHDPEYQHQAIEKTNYASLTATRLSNGEILPTLREYLLAGLKENVSTRLVVEIKPSDISKERGKKVAEKVFQLVTELNAEPMVVYISFDYDILKKILELSPGARTQYLNGDQTPDQLKRDGIAGADYHISVFQKHPEWVNQAKKNNIQLNAWTVNTPEDIKWVLSRKFDFITTNEPELVMDMVGR